MRFRQGMEGSELSLVVVEATEALLAAEVENEDVAVVDG